jgi:hypothetical protein
MKNRPIIKIVFGFFLGLGAIMYDTGINELDTFLMTIGLVGFAIFVNGTREQIRLSGKDVINPYVK